ncbi:MAG: DUF6056 family protein [Bacteroidota bacterium]|nr:DUF6056 family protein [Bacteroidota bacterium]
MHDRLAYIFTILFFLGSALCLLPFLWLCLYNLPLGMHEWDWMTQYAGTLPSSLPDQWIYFYTTEIGRYTSVAIASLTSLWCTLTLFPFYFIGIHLAWLGIIYWVVSAGTYDARSKIKWILTALFFLVYIDQIDDVYDSMFRYTGAICYLTGSILAALALIFFLKSKQTQSIVPKILFITALILCIGTNEISMMIIDIILFISYAKNRIIHKQTDRLLLTGLLVAIACSLLVVASPGNPIRVEAEGGTGMSLGAAFTMAIGASVYLWMKWLGAGILLLATPLILATIDFQNKTGPRHLFNDFRVWLILLIIIVLIPMFFLMFITGGDTFPERVIDHLFIYVMFVWTGLWISLFTKWKINLAQVVRSKKYSLFYSCGLLFLLFIVFSKGLDIDRTDKTSRDVFSMIRSNSNVSNAWLTLIKGEPQVYHSEMMIAYEELYTCKSDTCIMKKPENIPSQLYDPLSDRRNRKGDPFIGYYFNPSIHQVKYEIQ